MPCVLVLYIAELLRPFACTTGAAEEPYSRALGALGHCSERKYKSVTICTKSVSAFHRPPPQKSYIAPTSWVGVRGADAAPTDFNVEAPGGRANHQGRLRQ